METFLVEYTEEAVNDLRSIYDYIANEKLEPERASKLIGDILDSVRKLDNFPLRNPKTTFSPWKEVGIRNMIVKNHVVFYKVYETDLIVRVLRIFSCKRDISTIINN